MSWPVLHCEKSKDAEKGYLTETTLRSADPQPFGQKIPIFIHCRSRVQPRENLPVYLNVDLPDPDGPITHKYHRQGSIFRNHNM